MDFLTLSFWQGIVSSFNGERRIEAQTELEEKRGKTQLEIARINGELQEELQIRNHDFQETQQEKNHEFQEAQQERNHEFQEAQQERNHEFQNALFEKQKQLQYNLVTYNRDTQFKLAIYQRKAVKKQIEQKIILENWPLKSLIPSEIIDSHPPDKTTPLRIIIAPPEIDYDRFGKATQDFPKIEKRLTQGVREFLESHYFLHNSQHATELLGGAWNSNRLWGEAAIKRLFGMLKSEPFLIMESEVDGNYINLRFAYWSGGQDIYIYKTVFSGLPYKEIINEFAKMRLSNQAGEIKPNAKDFEKFCQFLIACHRLLVGLFVDAHYLIHYNLTPKLPQLLPTIIKDFPNHQKAQKMLQWIMSGYQELFEVLKFDRGYIVPELMLQFAQGFTSLNDKTWARKFVYDSMKYWFQLRGVNVEIIVNDKELIRSTLITIGDEKYLGQLNQCSKALGNNHSITQADILWRTWCELKITGTIPTDEYGATLFL